MITSSKLDSSYEILHDRSNDCDKDKTQRFQFKSLFWAVISTLVLVIMMVLVLDIYEISRFGTAWNSTTISIYYLIIIGLVFYLFVCGVISLIIVVRANKKGKLIALPMILLCRRQQPFNCCQGSTIIFFNRCQGNTIIFFNRCQGNAIIFYQFIGSLTILLASVAVTIHGIGIVIAAYANPLQVFSTVATVFVALFYLTYTFADIYDHYEDMSNTRSRVILRLLIHTFVLLFFFLFSYIYLTAVIFTDGDNIGIINFIANLLPIILLTFITWLSKHELQKFVNFKSSDRRKRTSSFLR